MGKTMNPTNYKNMINSLNSFATNTGKTAEELSIACSVCSKALGSEDIGAFQLSQDASKIAQNYLLLSEEARRIARDMQEELDNYYNKEQKIWSE